MRILLVEDDELLTKQLVDALSAAGHDVQHVGDGLGGEEFARTETFDVMIVDRMLPGKDGLEMLSALRADDITTPALILSALGQVDDRVTGLRAGGDDYLAKPYAFSELLARLEILGRRSEQRPSDTTIAIDDLTLDRINHSAERAGTKITLQPREYRLLEYLARNEGRLVTRTMLLENVWDLHFDPQTNVIDVHMSRLRAKVDKDFEKPLIHTIRGKGYRLAALSEDG